MYNISVSCEEIQTADGFVFKLPPDSLNQTHNRDCEQFWFSGDQCVADPMNPHKLIDPVTSVSLDRIVTSRCVNLIHEIICDASGSLHSHKTMFRVRNETAATLNSDVLDEVTPSLQLSDQLWWISVLLIFFLLAFLCFTLTKKIFRCFPKAVPSVCNDLDKRDPESDGTLMKVKSDSLNHSEPDGTLMKVKSDSLNHSESDGTLMMLRSEAHSESE
ncbi:uncharacterized protein LOC125247987 isoform X2 [Megalobrama amblycephala]|uniref:uncharacterized protein LOC125247987 isoform X2 n=1 Tax=Megalobrama amblycephala TaxID=75352 RepID=UPI002013DE06|nr:uncharacterized protein LOC125247987 isoform X2 [Megalobrama amblycephala]